MAFFPGTFDPFSLSHKGIVREIRNRGFTVYLALDEFSWSKRTQPRLVRRKIVNMSVADLFHVYLFPDDIPVNIANPRDLRRLRALPGRDIWICGGAETAMQLLRAGEIDVLRLSLIPTLLGGGRRLFGPLGREQRLRFLGCRAINGIAELTYVREGAGNDM